MSAEFRDLANANRQLQDWVTNEAGNRILWHDARDAVKALAEVQKALPSSLRAVPPEVASWIRFIESRVSTGLPEIRYSVLKHAGN